MKQREFASADVYLSAALTVFLGSSPDFRVENNRTLFVFPLTDKLYEALEAYNNGRPVNALEYGMVIRRLRGEMLSRRSMGTNR